MILSKSIERTIKKKQKKPQQSKKWLQFITDGAQHHLPNQQSYSLNNTTAMNLNGNSNTFKGKKKQAKNKVDDISLNSNVIIEAMKR